MNSASWSGGEIWHRPAGVNTVAERAVAVKVLDLHEAEGAAEGGPTVERGVLHDGIAEPFGRRSTREDLDRRLAA